MSAKEAQTASLVKKVVRKELTGSSQLLLGKSKIQTGRHGDIISYRCNKTETSVQSCEEKSSEEVITERQRQSPSMNPQDDQLDQNQFAQMLTALKRIFSSFNCFPCTFKCNHVEVKYHAGTIFNPHTRYSVDLKAQPAVGGISATEIQQCTTAEYKSSVEEKGAIKGKTFKLFNPLIIVPKLKPNTSWPENSLQLKACWRQKPKEASFFQECIGESNIPVEMIVLVNEHAEESKTLSTCPNNEAKCPDVLTVSVDVTDITSEMSNEDCEAFKTTHDDMNLEGI